jgi:adenosylhomocysteine nucleosidase
MSSPENLFVLIGALDNEIDEYVKHLEHPVTQSWKSFTFHEGLLFGKRVVVCKSGVGKVLAALITQKLIDTYNPSAVLFTGVAGGLSPELNVGDIVIADDCIQHDLDARGLGFERGAVPYSNYRFFKTDVRLKQIAMSTPSRYALHKGRILTGDHFITKNEMNSYHYLTDELHGDAVEMEGAAVGQVCVVHGVPFLIIRTISDKANQDAAIDFNAFLPEVAKNSLDVVSHILQSF